jgi:hypothetical protein
VECIRENIKANQEAKRAQDDLKAQQQMADWAFLMVWVSGVTALVTATGVIYVAATLIQTRKGVGAAVDAVDVTRDIGQRQIRAYLLFSSIKIEGFRRGEIANVTFAIENYGQTPARINNMLYGTIVLDDPEYGKIRDLPVAGEGSTVIIGGGHRYTQDIRIPIPDNETAMREITSEAKFFVFFGYISYKDIFGITRRTLARGQLQGSMIEDGNGTFRVTTRHNRTT